MLLYVLVAAVLLEPARSLLGHSPLHGAAARTTATSRTQLSSASLAEADAVTVRFVNTPEGPDVVISAAPGESLLAVGDTAGLRIPRACRTGVCNSCICDLRDPGWDLSQPEDPNAPPGFRPGHRIIRACNSKVAAQPEGGEMVVDVHRMREMASVAPDSKGGKGKTAPDSMARFSEDWENDYKPDYKSGGGPSTTAYDEDAPVWSSASGVPPWEQVW